MTVQELIDALSSCRRDAPVVFMDDWHMVSVGAVEPEHEICRDQDDTTKVVMLDAGERL